MFHPEVQHPVLHSDENCLEGLQGGQHDLHLMLRPSTVFQNFATSWIWTLPLLPWVEESIYMSDLDPVW